MDFQKGDKVKYREITTTVVGKIDDCHPHNYIIDAEPIITRTLTIDYSDWDKSQEEKYEGEFYFKPDDDIEHVIYTDEHCLTPVDEEEPSKEKNLEDLSYRELQKIAKKKGIKANQKKEELRRQIRKEWQTLDIEQLKKDSTDISKDTFNPDKEAILCSTEQEFNKVQRELIDMGYTWEHHDKHESLSDIKEEYGIHLSTINVFHIKNGNLYADSKEEVEEETNYKIIKAEEFLEEPERPPEELEFLADILSDEDTVGKLVDKAIDKVF